MGLESQLFKGDPKLEACLVKDAAHITQGAIGNHVGKIHTALKDLANLSIDASELAAKRYGPSTAAAVRKYKTHRNIINTSYQTKADSIVGKMTIRTLDHEMAAKEKGRTIPPPSPSPVPVTATRTCSLVSTSPYTSWPGDLLETLCRSYKANGKTIDGYKIDSLPQAFQFAMHIEPADFDDALNKAHAERVRTVYYRVKLHAGLWPFVNFIFETWATDNQGFTFSLNDVGDKARIRGLLDASPRFARDIPLMQYFHQAHPTRASKILVPTHQCWREVINGAPGLHICLTSNSIFDNGIHVDPHQIVMAKKPDGTCEYDVVALASHGWDIKKLLGL